MCSDMFSTRPYNDDRSDCVCSSAWPAAFVTRVLPKALVRLLTVKVTREPSAHAGVGNKPPAANV